MKFFVLLILVGFAGIISTQQAFAEDSFDSVSDFSEKDFETGRFSDIHYGEKFYQYKSEPFGALAADSASRCHFTSSFVLSSDSPSKSGNTMYRFPSDMIWPGGYENSTFYIARSPSFNFQEDNHFEKLTPTKTDDGMVLEFETVTGLNTFVVNSTAFWDSQKSQKIDCHNPFDFKKQEYEYYDFVYPLKVQQDYAKMWGLPEDDFLCKPQLIPVLKNDGSPACVKEQTIPKLIERDWTKYDNAPAVNWKKHITISAIRHDSSNLADTLPVFEIEGMHDDKMINRLLVGADGCKNETEVCKISSGVSIDRSYPFLPPGTYVSENDKFTVSLDVTQAEHLLSAVNWKSNGDLHYSIMQWDKKQYLLILSTFDNVMTPVVKMELVGMLHEPVSLERGMVLKYPIRINTWATYGADAEITLDSIQSTRDSGIKTWVEPSTLIVPERSSTNATLFVRASETARDGIYEIRIGGKANGNNAGLHCGHTDCPAVQVGDSDWSIRTFGSNTGMGIGSGKSQDDTHLELELNKKEFFEGETVEIKAYLTNNGTQPIVLDGPMSLLIKAIRADSKGYYDHFYGIDARNESDNSITIEPGSKVLLVRPFYWDQMTFENLDEEQRVEPSSRKMTATFVAGEHTWKDDTWFEIK